MVVTITGVWFATVLLLVTAPLAEAQASKADKIPRVGFLGGATGPVAPELWEAFRQGLRERGWVVGQNIVIEERSSEGKVERFTQLATELVRLNVDVIVAPHPWAASAAKRASATIPIVIIVVDDPVEAGLVHSLARPGGNVTGLTAAVGAADIIGKQLELLTQTIPNLSRVALLRDPTHPFAPTNVAEAERAARALRIHVHTIDVRDPDDFENAFAAMRKDRTGAIVVPPRMSLGHRHQLTALAAKHRLPAIFGFRQWAEAGGLIAYGPDFADLMRRTGIYVDKILRGANPGHLPVEQPTKFELVINLKAAKALGLTFPASVLNLADRVIE